MNLENKTRRKVLMLILVELCLIWEVINHLLPMRLL